MWIRAVRRSQAAFLEGLGEPDAIRAGVRAALSIHDFAEREPGDARLLAALRREDLIESVDAPRLVDQLAAINRPLERGVRDLARRLYGSATHDAVERTACAVIDLPIGATRRHLIAGAPLPPTLRPQLEAAVRAALGDPGG
jgi:hypothetical protein